MGKKSESGVIPLGHIDGLRGACALYVMIHHAFYQFWYDTPNGEFFPGVWGKILEIFNYGHFAVGYFIVISGFCIFQSTDARGYPYLRGGFKNYAIRRIRRIVPPYYLAILLYCLIVAMVPSLQSPSGRLWDDSLPIFDWQSLGTHFLFLHCNFTRFESTISGTFWSLGIEWWVYWLIPLFVLPLWRRFGAFIGVFSAFVLGFGVILTGIFNFDGCPWFVGLFALGILIAQISNATSETSKLFVTIRESKIPWFLLSAIVLSIAAYLFENSKPEWAQDLFVGVSCAFLLLGFSKKNGKSNGLKRFFESAILRKFGQFSFSLYLCHWIVLTLFLDQCIKHQLSLPWQLIVTFGLAVPSAVAYSWLFYRLVESPFEASRTLKTV